MPDEISTSLEDTKRSDESFLTALLAVVGFAFYWLGICTLLLSAAFSVDDGALLGAYLFRTLFLIGLCIMPILSGTRLPDALDTRQRRAGVRVVSCVLMVVLAVVALVPIPLPFPVEGALWLLLGTALGEVLVFWGIVWSGIDEERPEGSFCSMCVASSIILAAVACSAMLFAPYGASVTVAVVAFIASMELQHICGKRIPPVEAVTSKVSRERFDLWGPSMLTPGASAFALGIALALNGLVLGAEAAFPVAITGVGAGGLAALVTISLHGSAPHPSEVERVAFPIYAACLLLLPFMQDTGAFQVVMALLLADLVAYLVFHWDVLVLLAYRKRLKPIYHFGQGLIATSVAIAVGWTSVAIPTLVAGGFADSYTAGGWGTSGVPEFVTGNMWSLALTCCLVAVFVLVLALSIAPYASNGEIEGVLSSGDTETPSEPDPESVWESACEAICDEYGLTPREREVFAYLARGRNATRIAEELFISIHTVKTHSSRIYRKLGINSQQQLIDYVEEQAG